MNKKKYTLSKGTIVNLYDKETNELIDSNIYITADMPYDIDKYGKAKNMTINCVKVEKDTEISITKSDWDNLGKNQSMFNIIKYEYLPRKWWERLFRKKPIFNRYIIRANGAEIEQEVTGEVMIRVKKSLLDKDKIVGEVVIEVPRFDIESGKVREV